jgi:hypothetical protein
MRRKSWLVFVPALVLLRCAGDDEVHFGECTHAGDCRAGQICSPEARCVSVAIDPISDPPSSSSNDAQAPSLPDAAPPPPPPPDDSGVTPGRGEGQGKGKGKGKDEDDDENDDEDDDDDDD